MVAALVIGIGVIAGFELVRRERLSAALAVGLTLALWAGLVTFLLGRQIQFSHALALRDSLTGLPNRALLNDRIEQALARSRRTHEPFALLVAAHVVLTVAGAYRLLEREGPAPAPGDAVELEDGEYRCVRLTISPFPADTRRCALLERVPEPATG